MKASPSSLTDKPFFRIGEVARAVGVEPHVLRYWEREFRGIKPQKSSRGQRVYSKRDLDLLLEVRELLYAQGFTIAGAKKKLSRAGKAEAEAARATETAHAVERAPETQPDLAVVAGAGELREALLSLRQEFEDFLSELR